MLPLFPHQDTHRARAIIETIRPLAQVFWSQHDPLEFKRNPFAVMVVAMFSPRTKTEASRAAMRALFARASTPAQILEIPYDDVVLILTEYDIQFPESKARHLLDTASLLVRNGGVVPRTLGELMQYPGMGWKTSLLTLHLAYGLAPEICVDVHVTRIAKRMGLVNPQTQQPQSVSRELMDVVPHNLWLDVNSSLVFWGKTRCYPSRPHCEGCPVYQHCQRVGV
ncbi:MAG: endonuclease III domain-containing protein [Anaerolineae bacterium]